MVDRARSCCESVGVCGLGCARRRGKGEGKRGKSGMLESSARGAVGR